MEENSEMKSPTPATVTLTQALSLGAFDALKNLVPENEWDEKIGSKARELLIVETIARENPIGYRSVLREAIGNAYEDLSVRTVKAATTAAMDELEQILAVERAVDPSYRRTSDLADRLATAFRAPYVGDADKQLHQYLLRCSAAYRADPERYTSPYVTVTQSSGFGKSRLLHRLAETCASDSDSSSSTALSAECEEKAVDQVATTSESCTCAHAMWSGLRDFQSLPRR